MRLEYGLIVHGKCITFLQGEVVWIWENYAMKFIAEYPNIRFIILNWNVYEIWDRGLHASCLMFTFPFGLVTSNFHQFHFRPRFLRFRNEFSLEIFSYFFLVKNKNVTFYLHCVGKYIYNIWIMLDLFKIKCYISRPVPNWSQN